VNRIELKSIGPPSSIQEAMEKQMRAERDKRATILTAEGVKQSQILTAEGEKQALILSAEGDREAAILRAQGEAEATRHPTCSRTSTSRTCPRWPTGRG
jgi:regulator of protease activity HflC (stomatin/prohibitin superfamily)